MFLAPFLVLAVVALAALGFVVFALATVGLFWQGWRCYSFVVFGFGLAGAWTLLGLYSPDHGAKWPEMQVFLGVAAFGVVSPVVLVAFTVFQWLRRAFPFGPDVDATDA